MTQSGPYIGIDGCPGGWALRKKILEVDAHMSDSRIHEVHPEVCFQLLAGASLRHSKKTWGGHEERRVLLESAGIVVPAELGNANRAGVDDVLDAAVAAWTARRLARGEAKSFPEGATQRDRSGRVIVIWG